MKSLAIVILFFLCCCKEPNKPKVNEPIKIYSWEEYEKIKAKNPKQQIKIIDTICPFETKKAEMDIKKNKLVFYSYACIAGTLDELNLLLKPYHIIAREGGKSCSRPPKGLNYYCYEDLMHTEIENRYGRKWTDSMETAAIKNYVIKNPDKPYFESGKDLRDKYIKK